MGVDRAIQRQNERVKVVFAVCLSMSWKETWISMIHTLPQPTLDVGKLKRKNIHKSFTKRVSLDVRSHFVIVIHKSHEFEL